jgi:VCBS repeat-containing protein
LAAAVALLAVSIAASASAGPPPGSPEPAPEVRRTNYDIVLEPLRTAQMATNNGSLMTLVFVNLSVANVASYTATSSGIGFSEAETIPVGGQMIFPPIDYKGTPLVVTNTTNIHAPANLRVVLTGPTDTPTVLDDGPYQVVTGRLLVVETAEGVLANDSPHLLTATLVTGPQWGTLTLYRDGSFRYQHDGSNASFDSFTYQATTETTGSAEATVNLSIRPNSPPTRPGNE